MGGIQMARIEESVEIHSPAEKAFAYITDAKSWNKWQSVILEAEQTSQGSVGIGTTFRGTTRMMGRSMPWTAKTTEFEPPKKFGKTITSGSLLIEQHEIFQPVSGGTRFTLNYDVTVSGLLILLSPLLIRSMRTELRKSLINLKQILEAKT
jgi:Polyketide cyclase / dehydrase and lipid transport.